MVFPWKISRCTLSYENVVNIISILLPWNSMRRWTTCRVDSTSSVFLSCMIKCEREPSYWCRHFSKLHTLSRQLLSSTFRRNLTHLTRNARIALAPACKARYKFLIMLNWFIIFLFKSKNQLSKRSKIQTLNRHPPLADADDDRHSNQKRQGLQQIRSVSSDRVADETVITTIVEVTGKSWTVLVLRA